jgi:hypothetical protein
MQKESKIWLELKEISPQLAETALQATPYLAPGEYFEHFPGLLMAKIRGLENATTLAEIGELSETIARIPKQEVYAVPQDFFENFPYQLLTRIKAEQAETIGEELEILSPVLGALDKKNPYSTPEGYFNELAENLAGGIQAVEFVNGELENLPPVMDNLKKVNPYRVPQNYFEELPDKIMQRLRSLSQPARIIPFYKKMPGLKYAMAAAVTGILITIGIFTFTNRNIASVDPVAALAKASDQDIVNYMANQDILLSEQTSSSTASQELNENDVSDLFNEIPDAELQQYMNERSSGKDLITN